MIIDAFSGPILEPEGFAGPAVGLTRLRGYREHFQGVPPLRSRGELDAAMRASRDEAKAQCPTLEEFVGTLDVSGIDVAAVFTERTETSIGTPNASNQAVAVQVGATGGRLVGIGGVDPWMPDSVDVVEQARELGLVGMLVSPFKQRLDAGDPRLSRVFAACERLGMPVYVHTGVNWFLESEYDAGHPRGIDRIASTFPDLKIVAVHAAWPWVLDMMVVAWRHPNVYVDISTHRPRHFVVPESGWGPLLHFGSRMLADRILFGSTWTTLGVPPADLIREIRELPIPDHVAEQWLGLNAARLLGLD